jgi:hypothetical protein
MIWPVVKVIVAGTGRLNVIVSPRLAAAMVSLSDPGPLSAVFITVNVAKALARREINPELKVEIAIKTRALVAASLPNVDLLINALLFPRLHIW